MGDTMTTTDVIVHGRAVIERHPELRNASATLGRFLNTLTPLERAAYRRYMRVVFFPPTEADLGTPLNVDDMPDPIDYTKPTHEEDLTDGQDDTLDDRPDHLIRDT